MAAEDYNAIFAWLLKERDYQTKKFDYETERDKDFDWWDQQFSSYIQRLGVFGLDTPQGFQAALKLTATGMALCEHFMAKAPMPNPGYSSGELHFGEDEQAPTS